jgi:hypothetical protein
MAGYSGTPLDKKLGIKSGSRVLTVGAPREYMSWLRPLPENVTLSARLRGKVDIIHLFTTERKKLASYLPGARERIAPDGMIWVSWPKKAAKVPSDISEDTVREVALPLGLVDVKVCAVSVVWSGLKLVIRKQLR